MPQFPIKGPGGGVIAFVDIFTKLLDERIIFLASGMYDRYGQGQLADIVADQVTASMLYLESQNPEEDIKLYINSPGGSVSSALAIYDTMQYLKCDVQTICLGTAASAAALLLAAGAKGKRYALPNSRILIHQPVGGASGQAIDVKIHAEELLKIRDRINRILALHTGQPLEKIERDTDRDFFMTPEEAKEYGIIDEIIKSKKELE